MNLFGRLLLVIAGLALSMTTSIMVAIHGWGLEVRSWWWVIGGTLTGVMLAQMFLEAAKTKED